MLMTEQALSRRKERMFPQPERSKKVRDSMAAVKTVLGEREREAELKKAQEENEEEVDEEVDEEVSQQG